MYSYLFIRHVFEGINPRGGRVANFKVPTMKGLQMRSLEPKDDLAEVRIEQALRAGTGIPRQNPPS
jgi:hypothetical protein